MLNFIRTMRAPGKYTNDVKLRMPRAAHLTTSAAELPGLAAPMPGRQDFDFQHSGEIILVHRSGSISYALVCIYGRCHR